MRRRRREKRKETQIKRAQKKRINNFGTTRETERNRGLERGCELDNDKSKTHIKKEEAKTRKIRNQRKRSIEDRFTLGPNCHVQNLSTTMHP